MSSSYKDFLTAALSFMFPMAIVVQNFIIKTFLIKVGALVIIFSLSRGIFSPPCLSGIGIHYLSLEMELLSNAHTCQYKNCPSHIGGNSLSVSEDSHD